MAPVGRASRNRSITRRSGARKCKNAMAFVPIPDVWQVELRYTYLEEQCENTLYFKATSGNPDNSPIDLSNAVLLWWNANIRPYLSNQLTLREIYVTDLSSATGAAYTFVPPTPLPVGGDTAAAMPGNVSLAVSFRTAARGRSYRGRNYIVGLVEPAVTGNAVSTDFASGMQTGYSELLDSPFSDDWLWVVASRFANNAPRAVGLATPVTSVTVVDPYVDSQRRRLRGRGR